MQNALHTTSLILTSTTTNTSIPLGHDCLTARMTGHSLQLWDLMSQPSISFLKAVLDLPGTNLLFLKPISHNAGCQPHGNLHSHSCNCVLLHQVFTPPSSLHPLLHGWCPNQMLIHLIVSYSHFARVLNGATVHYSTFFSRLCVPLQIKYSSCCSALLETCVHLYNLWTHHVGLNQICTVYMLIWERRSCGLHLESFCLVISRRMTGFASLIWLHTQMQTLVFFNGSTVDDFPQDFTDRMSAVNFCASQLW